MSSVKPRQYPVPKALQSSSFGPMATLDDMEIVATWNSPAGAWAAKVLARENDRLLDEMLGEDTRLPVGVLASGEEREVVTGLVNVNGETWKDRSWQLPQEPEPEQRLINLSEEEVAYVARALNEGADGVVLQSSLPVAFLSALVAAGPVDAPPEGSVPVAIVDALDKDAVLELLAIAPGPVAYRRNDGAWHQDSGWLRVVGSVAPPPMVKLDESLLASVTQQVDEATAGVEFEELTTADAKLYSTVASGYLEELRQEEEEAAVKVTMALLAVAGRELSPADVKNTEKLRRYWLYGKGAAKIRWGTPGAWRRCHRNLIKHLGPKMTPGYCTNLSKRLGGPGIATHVGSKRK